MRFLAIVLLAIVGSAFAAPDANLAMEASFDGLNSTQCIYRPEDHIFTCRGKDEIQCNAIFDATLVGAEAVNRDFIYGIGLAIDSSASLESQRFWIYPRELNNTSYMNHTLISGKGRNVNLVIGCGEKSFTDVSGIRISDCQCFEKLVARFEQASKVPHMVRLESGSNVVEEIPLIGEVLIMDKHVQKRFLGWGFGWGLGLLGWGWGFPFWG